MNRIKIHLTALLLILSLFSKGQEEIGEPLLTPPQPVGGKGQIVQVMKTQMVIPPKFLKAEDKDVTIFFTVTKEGKVLNPFFKEKFGNFYEGEVRRLLNYFLFEPGKQGGATVETFGYVSFNFSADKYKQWVKERNSYKVKLEKPQDSTFTIYEIADKSPEFYKGDDALAEFILNNIEYPNVAKTQNIEGTVTLSFVVETNGYVSNAKVLKGVAGGCSEEAVRVVSMLRFKPAEKNGKYVRYKTNYPITFNLKIVNRDATNND
jgi:TonB family protein